MASKIVESLAKKYPYQPLDGLQLTQAAGWGSHG